LSCECTSKDAEIQKLRAENAALKRAGLHKSQGTGLPDGTLVILPNGVGAVVTDGGMFDETSITKVAMVDMGGGIVFLPSDQADRLGFHGPTKPGEDPAAGTEHVGKAVRKALGTPGRIRNDSAPLPGGPLGGKFFS
jgi:hypothetical protein